MECIVSTLKKIANIEQIEQNQPDNDAVKDLLFKSFQKKDKPPSCHMTI